MNGESFNDAGRKQYSLQLFSLTELLPFGEEAKKRFYLKI